MDRLGYVQILGRLGYSAKGIVYVLLGWLALLSALGSSKKILNSEGAVREIWKQPLGTYWVLILALGLLGYSIWRLLQAFLDTEHKGKSLKGWGSRVGFFISALVYANLSLYAFAKVIGENRSSGGEKEGAATLLSLPLGWLFVLLVGVIFTLVGLWQIYRAISAKFMEQYENTRLTQKHCTSLKWIGRIGIATRAICFVVIGTFFIQAGLHENAEEARGLSSVFHTMALQFGSAVVIALAVGFMVYGLYCFTRAAFRSFKGEPKVKLRPH